MMKSCYYLYTIAMNRAIQLMAQWFIDGGMGQCFNFPGFYSQQLFAAVWWKVTSVNEKVSYETWWWASMSWKRTLVTLKNVGLNVAADPFLNSHLVWANWGLVLSVFDDIDVEWSQSRLDTRHYFDFYWWLWLEPYDWQSLYDCCYDAFRLSESFQIPVVVRITNGILRLDEKQLLGIQTKIYQKWEKKLHNNHELRVVHPTNYLYQHKQLQDKHKTIQAYVDALYPQVSRATKLIVWPSRYAHHISDDILQLFTLPLPSTLIKKLQISEVFEQGDAVVYNKVQQALSRWNNMKSFTWWFLDNSASYITTSHYEKLFRLIKDVWFDCVVWDLGEYTSDNLKTIDYCLSFWSATAVAMWLKMGWSNPLCVIGDGAYYHSGKNALPELRQRGIGIPIIVLQNGWSQSSWWQIIPHDNNQEANNWYNVESFHLNSFDYDKLFSILSASRSAIVPIVIHIHC